MKAVMDCVSLCGKCAITSRHEVGDLHVWVTTQENLANLMLNSLSHFLSLSLNSDQRQSFSNSYFHFLCYDEAGL